MIQRYGWKPSLPDQRDLIADASEIKILPEVDPRGDYMTDMLDQLRLGSCTAQTVQEAIDAWLIVNGKPPFHGSRLAIYALERILEGSPLNADTGAYGRDGFKAAQKWGMLPETGQWAYTDKAPAWKKDPRPDIAKRTDDVRLTSPYKAVPRSIDQFKAVLSNRQTIAIGFTVYESFESTDTAATGVMSIPERGEKALGGHEVLVVGYLRSEPHYALVRNHWGDRWGMRGYFLMPWAVLMDARMSSDFRTIYRPL